MQVVFRLAQPLSSPLWLALAVPTDCRSFTPCQGRAAGRWRAGWADWPHQRKVSAAHSEGLGSLSRGCLLALRIACVPITQAFNHSRLYLCIWLWASLWLDNKHRIMGWWGMVRRQAAVWCLLSSDKFSLIIPWFYFRCPQLLRVWPRGSLLLEALFSCQTWRAHMSGFKSWIFI